VSKGKKETHSRYQSKESVKMTLPVDRQVKAQEEGLIFVAPYDDPYTIAGQGTIGNEILRQLSTLDLDNLHAIFVAIGGGGLIAGIAAYVKALRPEVKVIGVEPTGVSHIPSRHVTSHQPLALVHTPIHALPGR
jgi:threonine dehydratase